MLERLGHRVARHARHHDIQEDQVGQRVALEDAQCLLAAVGDLDAITVLQQIDHQHQVVGGVVDHQKGRRYRRGLHAVH
ncbi:hypothetical protein D3C76_1242960 [compost metagenome]